MSLPTNKHGGRDMIPHKVRPPPSSSSTTTAAAASTMPQSKRVKIPMQLMGLAHKEADKLAQGGYMPREEVSDHAGDFCGDQASVVDKNDESASTSAAAIGRTKPALREPAPKGSAAAAGGSVKHSPNQIAAASQMRFTRELSSYTRAVCMRLGYA